MTQPLFTMVQLNDVHFTLGADPRNTQGKLRALFWMLRQKEAPLVSPPDLLLLNGDLVDEPREADLGRFFAELEGPFNGARRMAVPGNHDAFPPDNPPRDAPFFRIAPADPQGEVVRFRGVTFILLNNADGDQAPSPRIAARNEWLDRALARHAGEPKIIATHVPLVSMRDPDPLSAGFAFPTWTNRDGGELLGLIECHADSVIAVLNGHLHLTARVERAGIQHIVASGLLSWPGDVGHYSFYPDRVEVRMVSLPEWTDPGEFGRWPLRNGIYDRWACDLTDARHPTLAEFIRGRAEEREFSVALIGKKVIAR